MKLRGLIILILVLAIVGAAAWNAAQAIQRVVAPAPTETPVTRVKRGKVAITVTARGELQGGKPEMLVTPMVGSDTLTITDLRQNGEMVNEGDVVVGFDTTQQEYNLREAEAHLAEAQQRVVQTEAENQAADVEARQAVESAKTEVKVAQTELRRHPFVAPIKARDNEIALEAAQNRLKQAEKDLANRR